MNNLNKNRIKIIKKRDPKSIEPTRVEVMRIGARVTTLTFKKRKDGRVKAETRYHTDFSIVPEVREIRDVGQETEYRQSSRSKEIR